MTDELEGLDLISHEFGEAYANYKESENEKNAKQKAFFDALTDRWSQKRRPRKSLDLSSVTKEGEEEAYIAKFYPTWRLVSDITDRRKVVIERDPSLLPDTYVNHYDGMVYGRTTNTKPEWIDIEALKENDPELWEQMTQWDVPKWLADFADWFVGNPEGIEFEVQNFLDIRGKELGIPRVLRPSNEWTAKEATQMRKYIVPGAVTPKLVAPREAKEEELEDIDG